MAADMTGTDTPSPSKPATINLQDEPQKGEDKTGSERDSARMNDHVRVGAALVSDGRWERCVPRSSSYQM